MEGYQHAMQSLRKAQGFVSLSSVLVSTVKVKLHLCLKKHHTMKTYGGVEV